MDHAQRSVLHHMVLPKSDLFSRAISMHLGSRELLVEAVERPSKKDKNPYLP